MPAYLQEGHLVRIELPVIDPGSEHREMLEAQIKKVMPSSFMVQVPTRNARFQEPDKKSIYQIFMQYNDYLYSGQSRVLATGDDNGQWYLLSIPDRIKRVENRHWVRVAVDLNVNYRLFDYNWPFYEANTINLSAGGLLFQANHIVDEKLELELDIQLPGGRPINSVVKVIRCAEYSTRWGEHYKIGCKFQHIQERTREKLVQFVFQKQRDLLQKRQSAIR
ncbi:MAG TPA: PilZ domain-containing protein [Syntrophomonadaceae bacterium]|nr:PilZ domain-containing protein [Syntrophomonadaceae bacterium]